MNNVLFQQAKAASSEGDYNRALDLYGQCLADAESPLEEGETGLVYHQMGNCLTKLKSYYEAIEAYAQAAADTAYDACGTVNCNMGMAYAALRDWNNAVKHFEIAVSDRNYPTKYKAYTGMGNCLLKEGKSAEAGVAFREAALDESNPDPTKALLNLGVCFMALGRPADAVASYESAMQFYMDSQTRNKMYASLGQAYVACGHMQKGVEAFETALADHTYTLSASAAVDYQRAVGMVSQGTSDTTQALPTIADTSGFDVVTTDEGSFMDQGSYAEPDESTAGYYFADELEAEGDPGVTQEHFFNDTDQELEEWSKGMVKLERKRRGVGLKIFIAFLIVLLLAMGAAIFLYWQGYGYPMQETVVEQLFADPASHDAYIDGVTDETIASISELIPAGSTVKVDGVNRDMRESTAYATITTPQGGEVMYEIKLLRSNFIGWKVYDVDIYHPSTQ